MRTAIASIVAVGLAISFDHVAGQGQDFDFAITPKFLERLQTGHTILPSFRVHVEARSDVKGVAQDCEVHLAGQLLNEEFGEPEAVISEPPNECRFLPGGTNPTTKATAATWRSLLDKHVIGKDCDIVGFPRVFTEHADSGKAGTSNPNHVFELHPALRIACDGETPLEFFHALIAPKGLRHINATSAASCLADRKLSVRFKDGQYEFVQSGGQGCGNFAIVEVGSLNPAWILATTGGHSAIARVSADGSTRDSLKLYSLSGTQGDAWLASLMPPPGTKAKILTNRVLLHGVFTYDYFAIIKELHDENANQWKQPSKWTEIPFPLAFIVYGQTETVPWTE